MKEKYTITIRTIQEMTIQYRFQAEIGTMNKKEVG
jgi:hypothetical protein